MNWFNSRFEKIRLKGTIRLRIATINQLQHSALYVTRKLHAIVNLEFIKNWHFIIPRAVPHTRANYRGDES